MKLHRGDRGVFDVLAAGKKIYSKDDAGRFPDPAEIAAEVAALLA